MEKKDLKANYTNNKLKKIIMGCIGLLALILVVAYVGIAQYYKKHFFANTYINGMDCSNLTASEAKELITTNVNTYVLGITARDGSKEKIGAKDIDLTCTFERELTDVLAEQSVYTWLVNAFKENKVDHPYQLHYDEKKLDARIKNLGFLDKEKQIEPSNATISKYSEETGFTIVKEDQGNKIIKKKLKKAIVDAVNSLESNLVLEKTDCYKTPTVYSDDPILKKTLDTIGKYMQTKLTYRFGDKTEVFDGSKIGPAIKVDDEYNVIIDNAVVKEFVDYIGKTYNTIFTNRKFKTSYGTEIVVEGGDYGWWLNRNEELKQVIECIKNGEQKEKEPVYYQKAVQYGEDDLGNTYVEINLGAQHLFVYKDGKRVLESDFVSGNVSKGYATPTGVYPIQYKETDTYLKGQNGDGTSYRSHVDYWMPFNGGIGMHDATWRKGVFGGTIYKNNGSHGCINLPPEKAKAIFGIISKGTPVIVYDTSKQK